GSILIGKQPPLPQGNSQCWEESRSHDLRNGRRHICGRGGRLALCREIDPVPRPSGRQAGHTRRRFDTRQGLNISQDLVVITTDAVFFAVLSLRQHDMESEDIATIKAHVIGYKSAESLYQ